jgi:hypothetical protein
MKINFVNTKKFSSSAFFIELKSFPQEKLCTLKNKNVMSEKK